MTNLTIGFLLVNKIKHLPRIAINSALINSNANLVIGYINELDIRDLPIHRRITYVKLDESRLPSHGYSSYEDQEFFEIVKLKWKLFSKLQEISETKVICYLDLDVILLKNFEEMISNFFIKNPTKLVLVQDDSVRPDIPQLCMGMFAFRNIPSAEEIFATCSKIHMDKSKAEKRIGDDEIITQFYVDDPNQISLLPQSTFPTGRLINTFIHNSNFIGISTAPPYIFHANYLVGTRKKSLVLARIAIKSGLKPKDLGIGFLDSQIIRVDFIMRSVYRKLPAILDSRNLRAKKAARQISISS